MAMPNRHIALGGLAGCLVYKLLGGAAGIAAGAVVALLSHIPIDLAFDEAWNWTADENRSNAVALGLLIIGMAVPMIHFFNWWAVLFAVASVLPDIIDDGMNWLLKVYWFKPFSPIFPTHFGSRPWHWNQWLLTESKMTTLLWEVNSSAAVIVVLGVIYFIKAH